MFWSGNYIAVRELNSLLKEENVTLSQVLEADDILQECKADNKALIQFLTKPEILADLITLIIEEPPKNVELAAQYRHANTACEVLTSHLSMLSDRLSLDTVQMNRLCDFINRDPPLNPLLASYFSKTVEMLLEKSPKQDWCLHHIVCLRVLDFFKSRRDFLPNLFRHMSTSAIADIFKCLLRIDDLIKTVMEWLEEYQFLECLIQIICGTYVPEVYPSNDSVPEVLEKAQRETSEKAHANHTDGHSGEIVDGENDTSKIDPNSEDGTPTDGTTTTPLDGTDGMKAQAEAEAVAAAAEEAKSIAASRIAAAASANAAALLCDLIVNGCRSGAARRALSALRGEGGVRALLQAVFTSPPHARPAALAHGAHVLLALLHCDVTQGAEKSIEEEAQRTHAECSERSGVELAVAPHLPLLHQALLQGGGARVGRARVHAAALLAHLATSEVDEVAKTMLTLGTPGVLVDMFFKYPNNNFLHAQVYTLVKNALNNRVFRTQYTRHLVIECDLLTRLMDVFEENKNNKGDPQKPRGAYMGHAVLCLAAAARALGGTDACDTLSLAPAVARRWELFVDAVLRPLLHQHDTPLGGYYPPENFYESEGMPDTLAANYDFNDMATTGTIEELTDEGNPDDVNEICGAVGSSRDSAEFIADGLGIDDSDQFAEAKKSFMEMACQRFDDDMWDDSGDTDGDTEAPAELLRDVLDQHSPWESAESGPGGGEGWAHFADGAGRGAAGLAPYWAYADPSSTSELESNLRTMQLEGDLADKSMDEASSVELANNLLTAMSAMSADAIANIVNANLTTPPSPPSASTSEATPSQTTGGQENPDTEHR